MRANWAVGPLPPEPAAAAYRKRAGETRGLGAGTDAYGRKLRSQDLAGFEAGQLDGAAMLVFHSQIVSCMCALFDILPHHG